MTTQINTIQQIVTDILTPVAMFVAWFGLSAYLLTKHASPLVELM
jgi:hypothetical protein